MPLLIRTDPLHPDETALLDAVDILRGGGILAYPTETFYGLGADGRNEQAIERIFALKGRNFDKPLPLIIGTEGDLADLVEEVPAVAEKLMKVFWPGALTLVFRASPLLLPKLTAGTGKIGLRISSHPTAARLAAILSRPLTATSANRSGGRECSSAEEVQEVFGDRLDAVIDGGRTPGGTGSTIVDVTTDPPAILRTGAIPPSLIRRTLGKNG